MESIEGFLIAVRRDVQRAKKYQEFPHPNVVELGVVATGFTPMPVDVEGMPLTFHPNFSKDLVSQVWH